MFNRIRNIWNLGRYKLSDRSQIVHHDGKGNYTKLFNLEEDEPLGNGNAEFLGEGSVEDYKEMEREDKGMKNIFGIGL